jgi:ABC-type uncharacterized transport system substrate-binding protein
MASANKVSQQSILRIGIAIVMALSIATSSAESQSTLSYGQYMYLLKSLKPALKNIGVMASTLTTEEIESLGRAATGLGIKVTVAKVTDARDIAGLYKTLVSEHRAEVIWIPDAADKLLLGVGFEYLRENTILDRVGLCVPARELVSDGALCSFKHDNQKFIVYVNRRVAQVVGINLPTNQNQDIAYVAQ